MKAARVILPVFVLASFAGMIYVVVSQPQAYNFDLSLFVVVTSLSLIVTIHYNVSLGISINGPLLYFAALTQPAINTYVIIVSSFIIAKIVSNLLNLKVFSNILRDFRFVYNVAVQIIIATLSLPISSNIKNMTGVPEITVVFSIFLLMSAVQFALVYFAMMISSNSSGSTQNNPRLLIHSLVINAVIASLYFLLSKSGGMIGFIIFSTFLLLSHGSIINNMSGTEISKNLITDSLTNVYNRRFFDGTLRDLLSQRRAFTLLFIDLDDFKSVNDKYGHIAGDDVLASFAAQIKKRLRKEDMIFRYAGDEFCVLFFERVQADNFKDRMISTGKNLEFHLNNHVINRSFSMGSLDYTGDRDTSFEDVIHYADEKMYQDKRQRKE